MFNKFDAIVSLRPGCGFALNQDGSMEWSSMNASSCPTNEEIAAEIIRLQAEYDVKEYARNRAAEYPSYADQFDTIFHQGLDAWKAQIQAVKTKYPKS